MGMCVNPKFVRTLLGKFLENQIKEKRWGKEKKRRQTSGELDLKQQLITFWCRKTVTTKYLSFDRPSPPPVKNTVTKKT